MWKIVFILCIGFTQNLFATCASNLKDTLSLDQSWKVESVTENVFGQNIEYTKLTHRDSGRVEATDLFGPEHFVLGFDQTGHMYVVNSDTRFDGRTRFQTPLFNDHTDLLDPGLILSFVPQVAQMSEKQQLLKYRSLTCIGGACSYIKDKFGLRIKRNLRLFPWDPSAIINSIFSGDLVNRKGQPVEFKMYLVNSDSLVNSLQRYDLTTNQAIGNFLKFKGWKEALKNLL